MMSQYRDSVELKTAIEQLYSVLGRYPEPKSMP